MKIKRLKEYGFGYAFMLVDGNGNEQCRFRCSPDFTTTGYVESFSGIWPGEFQTHFEVPPLSEAADLSPWRVRLTAGGVEACLEAVGAGQQVAEAVAA